MFKEVARLLVKKSAGVGLLCAGLLALAALLGGARVADAGTASVTTIHWKDGATQGYSLQAVVVPNENYGVSTVTMTGPQAATAVDLIADSTGTYSAAIDLATRPTVGDTYTFRVTSIDTAATENVVATVTAVNDAFATPVAPAGAVASPANPTFSWTPPTVAPAGGYVLSLSDGDTFGWSDTQLAPEAVSDQYPNGTLTPGINYTWSIAALDGQGNRAENRSSFMPGTNFTGRVTNVSGAPLAGITVSVADVAGNTQPTVATTLADGTYRYGGLATGSYTVSFSTGTAFENVYYSNELFNGDLLAVTGGVLTANVDAVMGWGSVTGSVYVKTHPTGGVQVAMYDTNKNFLSTLPAATILADSGVYGTFDLRLIPPGNYYVKFSAQGYPDVWRLVTVVAYQATSADVVLSSGIPTVTSFTVPATANSSVVRGISVTASEFNGNITGFLLTESPTQPSASAAGWSTTAPTSYTFANIPVGVPTTKTLYAWAKGTGGVSESMSAPVTLTVTFTKPGDADFNGTVSISEVQSAINMYLGLKAPASYVDLDNTGAVSISEVQKVINAYLGM